MSCTSRFVTYNTPGRLLRLGAPPLVRPVDNGFNLLSADGGFGLLLRANHLRSCRVTPQHNPHQ